MGKKPVWEKDHSFSVRSIETNAPVRLSGRDVEWIVRYGDLTEEPGMRCKGPGDFNRQEYLRSMGP